MIQSIKKDLSQLIKYQGLVKTAVEAGGDLHPLLIPADITNGTGLMNPSIYVNNGKLLCNIRHVNYTLYHSEIKKFQHRFGPLQYLHPENDRHLRTWNYLATLNSDCSIQQISKVNTEKLDIEPIWTFVGLEDGRLVKWHDHLYLTGVRRDTTTDGQGRMELSELQFHNQQVQEISRHRIPTPGDVQSYCEKNWMPVIDRPYHYIKWSNPTEVVCYDPVLKTTNTVHLDKNSYIPNLPDFRGGSQVIPYGNFYLAIIHEVDLTRFETGEKDAVYTHRFLVWDRQWNLIKYTDSFSFLQADIEFCCGVAWWEDNLLISFGFQDNAAFILKMPKTQLDQLLWGGETMTHTVIPGQLGSFSYGPVAQHNWFCRQLETEIFRDNVYQKYFSVESGDTVLDLGASVGIFPFVIQNKNPQRIICLEVDQDLVETMCDNFVKNNITAEIIPKAFGPNDGLTYVTGKFDPNKLHISDGNDGEIYDTISWATLKQQYNIEHIDFVKTDCEGAEYNLFNDENFHWVLSNVKKIAGEFHLHTADQKKKFRRFRDTYLIALPHFRAETMDYVDIKWAIWQDWFIERYSAINIWIDNRDPSRQIDIDLQQRKKWQHWPSPTLEITTIIPEKGCVVDCVFCPQRTLEKVYTGTRILSLENFKKLIDRVPQDVRITFAGFTEPWMNKYATDMVLYAHQQGHPISIFTTAVGLSVEDCEAIAHIPYAGNPNGGFCLHLPDSEMLARHPITPNFLKTLQWLRDNQHRIQNFSIMSMGPQLHPDIRHIFPSAPYYQMYSRAGNLNRESLLKPQLITLKDRWNAIEHTDRNRTCGCQEHLYHNVLLPNGDVSLCCMDYGLDHILGNLYEQTYEEIIPQAQSCFDLCNHCENGVNPSTTQQVIHFIK
jgi:FkbM family methyltransferase